MFISKRFIILLIILGMASFAVLGYLAVTAYDRVGVAYVRVNQNSVTNCKEIELVKGAVRATIEQSQKFVQTSHVRTAGEKAASDKYYTEVLARFSARNCEKPNKEKHGSRILRKTPWKH